MTFDLATKRERWRERERDGERGSEREREGERGRERERERERDSKGERGGKTEIAAHREKGKGGEREQIVHVCHTRITFDIIQWT
jgi:hypothetical protein